MWKFLFLASLKENRHNYHNQGPIFSHLWLRRRASTKTNLLEIYWGYIFHRIKNLILIQDRKNMRMCVRTYKILTNFLWTYNLFSEGIRQRTNMIISVSTLQCIQEKTARCFSRVIRPLRRHIYNFIIHRGPIFIYFRVCLLSVTGYPFDISITEIITLVYVEVASHLPVVTYKFSNNINA